MKRFPIIFLSALAVLFSCAKQVTLSTNEQKKQYLDDWLKNYPDAKDEAGLYLLEETPGTGAQWDESSGYAFVTAVVRNLKGTVLSYSDEAIAKQLEGKDFSSSDYYGPRAVAVGYGNSYYGFDKMLRGMKEGGKKTAVIPSWFMTFERYNTDAEYFEAESGTDTAIYTIYFHGQCADITEWEKNRIREYADANMPGAIGSSPNVDEIDADQILFVTNYLPAEVKTMPSDTTVYLNYTGRLLNGQVFDTTDAKVAADNNIYDSSRTYEPVSVTWSDSYSGISMGGSTSLITGFQAALFMMHPDEKASVVFTSTYGYGSSGSGTKIPAYAPLRFDLELVAKP